MTEFSLTTINFHDDTLYASKSAGGIYVSIKPICDRLGLDWRAQQKRLRRDPILNEGVSIMDTAFVGGGQEVTMLRLDLVNGWLFGVETSRVREELRPAILTYKRECFAVLHSHFFKERVASPEGRADMTDDAKLRLVREARQTHGTAAARKLWFELGLPTVPEMFKAARQGDFTVDLDVSGPPAITAVN